MYWLSNAFLRNECNIFKAIYIFSKPFYLCITKPIREPIELPIYKRQQISDHSHI